MDFLTTLVTLTFERSTKGYVQKGLTIISVPALVQSTIFLENASVKVYHIHPPTGSRGSLIRLDLHVLLSHDFKKSHKCTFPTVVWLLVLTDMKTAATISIS